MARVQISDLTELTSLDDVDFFHIKDGNDGVDKKFAYSNMLLDVDKGGTGATNITDAQTNLNVHDKSFFGTVAGKDITASSTDTTANRITKVGDGGLLTNNPRVTTDYDDLTSGISYGASTAPNAPDNLSNGVVTIRSDAGHAQQIAGTSLGDLFFRYANSSGTWQPWEEIWHSGNFDLGAQGLTGSEATAIIKRADDSNVGVQNSTAYADFNDITLNGMFRVNAGSANAPTAEGFQVFNTSTNTNLKTQLAGEWGSTLRMFGRSQNVSWGDWEEFTHSGNLVGTVTQGGATVVERGSNANGEYVKFADGTLICYIIGIDVGSTVETITLPTTYTDASYAVSSNGFVVGGSAVRLLLIATKSTSSLDARSVSGGSSGSAGRHDITIIGRWY